MKAKLMIGDLIRYTQDQCLTDEDKAPLTVTCIGEPEYPDYMPFIKVKGSNEKYHQDLFEPIPLTAEILEKNANVTKVGCCTYYEFGSDFAVKEFSGVFFFCELENGLLGKGEITDNTWMRMDYIHELQHALRLVGMNKLADNFKI